MSLLSVIVAGAGLTLSLATTTAMSLDEPKKESCSLCPSEKGKGETCSVADKELPMVDKELYAKADWPKHNSGESLYAKDYQGQALPVALGTEIWISEKASIEGKVVVLDFWATWCPPCVAAMPILDEMQVENKENLAVVAIGGQREDEDTVRSYVKENKKSIHSLYDSKQSVFKPFQSEGIPLVVVLSTDGVVRWIGNPHDPAFQPAVEQVIKNDPMIQAKS